MIDSLLYLTTNRSDIQFSVCLCARFQANPKESHLIVVKRIFRYLSEIVNIVYGILEVVNLHYMYFQMLIMLVVNLIARVQVTLIKSLQDVSYPGRQGNKGQLHCPQLKQNM